MQTGMLRLLTYHEVAGAEKDARLLQEAPFPLQWLEPLSRKQEEVGEVTGKLAGSANPPRSSRHVVLYGRGKESFGVS